MTIVLNGSNKSLWLFNRKSIYLFKNNIKIRGSNLKEKQFFKIFGKAILLKQVTLIFILILYDFSPDRYNEMITISSQIFCSSLNEAEHLIMNSNV
ncbi:MAG: hypothetical protein CVU39_23970 [Chloroflexi bacterium HGW-Chloroflexi-10]|nr:MAG: hypothetical protein CVU39_23970 [Chloroflexi bacterium HGW-Chloroflexi-10]